MEIKNIVKGVFQFIKQVQEAVPRDEWNQFCEDLKFSSSEVEEEKREAEELEREEREWDGTASTIHLVLSDDDEEEKDEEEEGD